MKKINKYLTIMSTLKTSSTTLNAAQSVVAPKLQAITGTFSPALPDDCVWCLWAPDNTIIGSGTIASTQKTTLVVALPSPVMAGTYKVSVRHSKSEYLFNQVVAQDGGLVIIENLEIHETMPKDMKATAANTGLIENLD